jgi:hypothetical protein
MNIISIFLLAIAASIIFATIFFGSFREKIFQHEEGGVEVFGVNVKGVSFVVLVLGLSALAVYLELNKPKKLELGEVVQFLKNSNEDSFRLDYSDPDEIKILLAEEHIASLKEKPRIDLQKNQEEIDQYAVQIANTHIGSLKLIVLEETKRDQGYHYQGVSYHVGNSDFWFKIENIESIPTRNGFKSQYTFRFGEGSSEEDVVWHDKKYLYGYTDSGLFPNEMTLIRNPVWRNSYAIAMSLGNLGTLNGRNYIGNINMLLISSGIEK